MKLSDLLGYENIVIQCHDNPDADAIASGFGLYEYFKAKGKDVRFIYSGNFQIKKSNLVFMVKMLNIPIEYVDSLSDMPDLLITCDCQYGEGNVRQFPAHKVAVIDHHQMATRIPELSDIRPNMGSCSTVIWDHLKNEGVKINTNLATAMYYGLLTDTNSFAELSHPLDKDMKENLPADTDLITKLCNMNITLDEVKIAGVALLGFEYHELHKYALLEAMPCDPNILGLISDLFLSVDSVDVCIVYSVVNFGIKFSVRSCTKEVRANELAQYMAKGIGSGGGHNDKAGGFIQQSLMEEAEPEYAASEESRKRLVVTTILRRRMHEYFRDCDIVYAGKDKIDMEGTKRYRKKSIKQGFFVPSEIYPLGTQLLVRSLEGDATFRVEEDSIVMIGIRGEVYVSRREVFDKNYKVLDDKYNLRLEYTPTVKNMDNGESMSIRPYAKMCVSEAGNVILAKKIDRTTKVFTKWNPKEYLKGEKGDYIAAKESDTDDVYIINDEIFHESYEEVL